MLLTAIVITGVMAGCAGPGPKLFPVVPTQTYASPDGLMQRWYDVDGNGAADYRESLSDVGRLVAIGYDPDEDGRVDENVELASVPADELHHLLIILDSVPVEMVRQAQMQGRLSFLHRPTRIISPFPVMTDPCLTEFFGLSPLIGVEASYYDGQRLHSGYNVYAHGDNAPWKSATDYYLAPVFHTVAYLWQQAWYEHDLRRIQEVFDERDAAGEKLTTAYVVGTSALGARQGPDGHVKGLVLIDQFCQEMIRRTHGRVRITLMSDHGHNLATSKRIRLRYLLSHMGYRVVDRLEKNGDVVVPEFGMVTCAVFHTRQPARAAADAVAFEGVDLAAYRETASQGENACEEVVVLSRAGRARIDRSAAGFRYRCDFGDPLELLPILEELQTQGQVDAAGFVDDRTLFEATCDHVYPDAVYRLWRAFHGLIVNTPDVYLSIKDGYEVGSPLMGRLVRIKSAHGNLRQLSSYGFAASMVDGLPDTARMIDLRPAMQAAGIPLTDPAVD